MGKPSMKPTAKSSQGTSKIDASLIAVVEEISDQLQRGLPVDIDQYVERYPDHAESLRSMYQALVAVTILGGDEELDESSSAMRLAPKRLGDFRIVREIGRGGMGVVYEAEQLSLGRHVALKVLPFASVLDATRLRRFKNEAMAAGGLEHPHIVPVYAVGCERGVHFYAMRLIQGSTLAEWISQLRSPRTSPAAASQATDAKAPRDGDTRPIAAISTAQPHDSAAQFRQMAEWGRQAALALQHAHDSGLVHRDIKPSNLLIDQDQQLWVTDFGLAQLPGDAQITLTGDILGTLRYMSPEQALGGRGVVDQRADIYSLGATLYELLCLQPAVRGTNREELIRHLTFDEPAPLRKLNRSIPVDLETIVTKAISKRPEDRYQSAADVAEDLERFIQGRPIQAKPATLVDVARRWSRRHQSLVAAGLVMLCLSVVGAAVASLLIARAWRSESRQRALAEENLEIARTAVDDWYVKFAEDWVIDDAHLSTEQRELLQDAADFYSRLSKSNAADPKLRLGTARAANRLASIHWSLDRSDLARRELERASALLHELSTSLADDREFREELSRVLVQQSIALPMDIADQITIAEQALDLNRSLLGEYPRDVRVKRNLAWSCMYLGQLYLDTFDYDLSDRLHAEAVSLFEELVAADSDDFLHRKYFATVLHAAAKSHLTRPRPGHWSMPRSGHREPAMRLYLRGLDVARDLMRTHPDHRSSRSCLVRGLVDAIFYLPVDEALALTEEATREAAVMVDQNPGRVDLREQQYLAQLQLAGICIQLGRHAQALQIARDEAVIGGWNEMLRQCESNALMGLERWTEAAESLEALIQLEVQASQSDLLSYVVDIGGHLSKLAGVYRELGREADVGTTEKRLSEHWSRSLAGISSLITDDNAKRYKCYFSRAFIHGELGNYEAALKDYSQVIALAPKKSEELRTAFRNRAALLCFKRHQYDLALVEATRAAEAFPDDVEALFYRAYVLYETAQFDEALQAFNRAAAVHERTKESCVNYGLRAEALYFLGRNVEALSDCELSISLGSPLAPADWARCVLVRVLCNGPAELRDIARARELLKEIGDPSDRAKAAGVVHLALGELDQARTVLEKLLEDGRHGAIPPLALVYARQHEYDLAAEYYHRAKDYFTRRTPLHARIHAKTMEEVESLLPADLLAPPTTNPARGEIR